MNIDQINEGVRQAGPIRGDRVYYITSRKRYESGFGGKRVDNQTNFDFFYHHDALTMGDLSRILQSHPGAIVKSVTPIYKSESSDAFIVVEFHDGE